MRQFTYILLAVLLSLNTELKAQDTNIQLSLQQSAYNYANSGEYLKSIETWDEYLRVVDLLEGRNTAKYFLGLVEKGNVLIKSERYNEAEIILNEAIDITAEGIGLNQLLYLYKSLAKCNYHLGRIEEAFHLYRFSYDSLLQYKDFFQAIDQGNNHWCWSDELASIALELADLYKLNGEYAEVEALIIHVFENIRKDNETCFSRNSILYHLCLSKLIGAYDDFIKSALEQNQSEEALQIYDIAVNVCKSDVGLIGYINRQSVNSIIKVLLDDNKETGIKYSNEYISLCQLYYRYLYDNGSMDFEEHIINIWYVHFNFGQLYEKMGFYDEAEISYKDAKILLEDSNMVNNEKYLNTLSLLSYIHELMHLSKVE